MKVTHVNFSDISGGAARASYRLHSALRKIDVDSRMLVNHATSTSWTVDSIDKKIGKIYTKITPHLASIYTRFLSTESQTLHSPSIIPSIFPNYLNKSDSDIINLHWIGGEMLSIRDVGKINRPVVWTMHDMWAFCGAEHVTEDFRWREGYRKNNRPKYESGFDLNRWTWSRKMKHWTEPIQIIAPSRWMADCVSESEIMKDWPVSVIPNTIDTDFWHPVDKQLAREIIGLPQDAPLILFGAMGGISDPNKGFNLLSPALDHVGKNMPGAELVVFGQLPPKNPLQINTPVHYAGLLHDDVSLILLYSAVDVLVIPSRKENLPNTALEASACGTPVVGFNTGGMSDVVEHQKTGYLAKVFNTEDLANGIYWTLSDDIRRRELGSNARKRAVLTWSNDIVAKQYNSLYQEVLVNNA